MINDQLQVWSPAPGLPSVFVTLPAVVVLIAVDEHVDDEIEKGVENTPCYNTRIYIWHDYERLRYGWPEKISRFVSSEMNKWTYRCKCMSTSRKGAWQSWRGSNSNSRLRMTFFHMLFKYIIIYSRKMTILYGTHTYGVLYKAYWWKWELLCVSSCFSSWLAVI